MRIAEYKQIDIEIITNEIEVDDFNEDGEVIGTHAETITKEVPVMGMVYRDATEEEIAEMQIDITIEEQIAQLKEQLSATDYKAIKYAEGWITEEEYAPIKAERERLRNEIRELEK